MTYMESLRDDRQREVLMRFFKTAPGEYGYGDEFLGIKVPQTREVVKLAAPDTPLSEIPELLMCRWHEVRLCGLLLLVWCFEKLATKRLVDDEEAILGRDRLLKLYLSHAEQANNWDLVDMTAPKILGHWLMLPSSLGPVETAHEHRMHVENLTAWRCFMVPALCRAPPSTPPRPHAQSRGMDAARDGQARVYRPAARLPQPARPRDASHHLALRHREAGTRGATILDEHTTQNVKPHSHACHTFLILPRKTVERPELNTK